ncbi:MAG TPA: HAD-IC family P-type ATPase [Aggregatilineales bacterium]|nr:HAD-IC family P-type ATPase [Aggregatilineales bacterium]
MPSPSHLTGLNAAEVAERIRRGETNAFKARVGRSYWDIIRDNVFNLFNIVLFTLLIIVVIMGDYAPAIFAGLSVVSNSILGSFQEISAKRKLDRLAALNASTVKVIREGVRQEVAISAVVKDDLIPIEPGDRLVVDGRILRADALEMDESQLTGESDAVLKEIDSAVSSGSFCIAGTGVMVATQVGKNSTINQLSSIAKAYRNVKTPTQKRIDSIVEITVIIMIILVPMLFIAGWLSQQPFLEIVKNLVVFVSSIVPQGLVLVAVLSLTIGAISISRHQTLIQRVNAVESMANVTVLCFDKTGTLTQNQLKVIDLKPLNGVSEKSIREQLKLYTEALAHRNKTAHAVADYCATTPSLNGSTPPKLKEIPFSSARKWGAVVFEQETLIMGAPERVLRSAGASAAIAEAEQLSTQGLRVLAFARTAAAPIDGLIQDAEPLALVILSDQVRPDIQATLQSFRDQDVRLKVISGDNLETVKAIALQAGMPIERAYTGEQLEAMNEADFVSAVQQGDLFARIEPDTKRRIIASLKGAGEYVAMVGDGVNDVPALKEAHLAVVMNDGAQISKDVGDIVLLNNAMSTLPLAFAEGREITQTIFATTKLFLAKNFYNIALIFFIGFMLLPFPTTPVQISWITFGTVNIPATLIAFKILRPSYMKQFRRDVMDYVLIAGMSGATMLAVLFVIAYFGTNSDFYAARSAVTMYIALYGILIFWHIHDIDILDTRSMIRGWKLVTLGVILTGLTMIVPFIVPEPFQFVPPAPMIWVAIMATFLITAILVTTQVRSRHLTKQLWQIFDP